MNIAIVGSSPASCWLAPFNDQNWQIWAINGVARQFPRWDMLFDLHPFQEFEPNYLEWMKEQTNPIYLQEAHPAVPSSVTFPKDDILRHFKPYFTNTVSWLIAYAMMHNPEKIHVFGIDMAAEDEYINQRPSVEYFLGLAEGRGIGVWTPTQSDLLKAAYLYGYEQPSNFRERMKARLKELETLEKRANDQILLWEKQKHVHIGQKENLEYMLRTWFYEPQ